MSVVKILNVGQGDSILLSPPEKCKYGESKIFVDLGRGGSDISAFVKKDEKISIVLTHHHHDHIGGLRCFASSMDRIEKIYLPLYLNEITLIAKAILHLKGINVSRNCSDFINDLQMVVDDQQFIGRLFARPEKTRIRFLYEGMNLCDHITVLNPPLRMSVLNSFGDGNRNEMIQLAQEMFESKFANDLIDYIDNNGRVRGDFSPEFDDFWIEDDRRMGNEMNEYGLALVLGFIARNVAYMRRFNEDSSRKNMRKILEQFVETCHDVCVVLRASYEKSILLTGDASKKVFDRFIDKGMHRELSAEYLKMPHHGSKHNMDRRILNSINPRVAIISHKNGHFGKSSDSHPSQEILDLLEEKDIEILVTNDVIKNHITLISKSDHCIDRDGFVEIE